MPSAISSGKTCRLAVISHKGGTGRTTIALGLAWVLGQQGQRVLFVDADPVGSALLTACDSAGVCRWKNVRVQAGIPETKEYENFDVVIIDCPSLSESAALPVLKFADQLILTCLADTLSLRTLPTALAALRQARRAGGRAVLLGLVFNLFDEASPIQRQLIQQIRSSKAPPILGAPIPIQPSLRDWALKPGSPMPAGLARAAILELAFALRERLSPPMHTEAFYA